VFNGELLITRFKPVFDFVGTTVSRREAACFSLAAFLWFLSAVSGHGQGVPTASVIAERGAPPALTEVENVFIFVIDGVRASEVFDDPSYQFVPHMGNDLKPLGTVYRNFYCMGYTGTTSGHAEITSGVTQFLHNTFMPKWGFSTIIQEEPSIFQYYRYQKQVPKEKTWIFDGKGKMISDTGICLNPAYGNSFGPTVAFEDHTPDNAVWAAVNNAIDTHHPSMTMVNFPNVDIFGHSANWDAYVMSIKMVDNIIYEICKKIWLDPYYEDNTLIIITADHGRCLDEVNSGFKSHGCTCEGCRRLPFLMIGPGIKENVEITTRAYQRDIAPTIAKALGIEAPFTQGQVLREAFEVPPPPTQPSQRSPVVAYDGEKLHLAFCASYKGGSLLYYASSADHGKTWDNVQVLSETNDNLFPRITAAEGSVAVGWSSAKQKYGYFRPYSLALRESKDGGSTWSNVHFAAGEYGWTRGYLHPDVCYHDGKLNVVFSSPLFKDGFIFLARLDDFNIEVLESFREQDVMRTRCAAAAAGIHSVYERFVYKDDRWEVCYRFFDGNTWSTRTVLSDGNERSNWPDIAADASGLHVVWAAEVDGTFKIMARSSQDGSTWDSPKVISGNQDGAWHPRIAASSNRIIAVWESYESKRPSIFFSESNDGGSTWTSPVKISAEEIPAVLPALAIDNSDNAHMIWMEGPPPSRLASENVQF